MVDDEVLAAVLRAQAGAVSRAQLIRAGVDPRRATLRVRRGAWQRVFPGVYVAYSGPLSWRARAHAALLYAGAGSALSHTTAGHVHGFVRTAPDVLTVSIPADRVVRSQRGLVLRRRRTMPISRGRPAVVGRGPTVVDIAQGARSIDDVVGLVTAAVRARTTPQEILDALDGRARVRHRGLLADLLQDVSEGIESVLEQRYQRDVERRHRLPAASLQRREAVGGRWIRADRVHDGLGVRIELDGELAHPGGRTDADVWRDNAVIIERAEITLRYRWRHVAGAPCVTARQVEMALRSRGWQDRPTPCSPRCPVGA